MKRLTRQQMEAELEACNLKIEEVLQGIDRYEKQRQGYTERREQAQLSAKRLRNRLRDMKKDSVVGIRTYSNTLVRLQTHEIDAKAMSGNEETLRKLVLVEMSVLNTYLARASDLTAELDQMGRLVEFPHDRRRSMAQNQDGS
ncbi:hypothetical protein [Myxococcus phage Mx1]|nr:hypothetical protein [Myxococcus phage Mx1]